MNKRLLLGFPLFFAAFFGVFTLINLIQNSKIEKIDIINLVTSFSCTLLIVFIPNIINVIRKRKIQNNYI